MITRQYKGVAESTPDGPWWGVKEVYIDSRGHELVLPTEFGGESLDVLIATLEMAVRDLKDQRDTQE